MKMQDCISIQWSSEQEIKKRLKRTEDTLMLMCDFIKKNSVKEIVSNNHFWHVLKNYCNTLPDYVCFQNYDISKKAIFEWINLMKLIISKDDSLRKIIQAGPLKSVLDELLNVDKEYPSWFIKTFFNSLFEDFQFGENVLPRFFKVIWGAISYSSQEAFLHVIISNFDHDSVYKFIRKYCTNKELQQLFDFIFDENGHQESIRNFLNYFNLYENPGNILSFISTYIKLNRFLLVQNTWVDLNIRSNSITFSAKKTDFCNKEESQYFRHHSEEDCDEFDVVTIKISHVSYVRFKSGLDDNEDELTFELNQPLTALYESSNEFLKKFRVVSIYFADNDERVKGFILQYFLKKAEVSINNLNPNNYELELVHSDSSNNSFDLSPTDTAQASQIVEEDINSENDDGELDENLIIDASGNDYRKYTSTITKTPESRGSANISVDESAAPDSDDSICCDSVSSSYEINHFKSTIFATPVPKSTNISVAASYDTPDISSIEDSEIGKEKNRKYGGIKIRTPTIINQLPIETIDLVSPVVVKKKNKYDQIEKCNNIESIEHVVEKCNDIESIEHVVEKCNDIESIEHVVEKCNDIESIEHVVAPPEPKEISQNPATEQNIVETPKPISQKRLSNVTDVSEVSEQSDQENLQQNEDNQQLLNSSFVSRGTQVSNESTRRKTRKRKSKTYDDSAEFDETSFFSDKETNEDIYIQTKTRRVRKHRPFQYNSDTGKNPRRSKKINKEKVSEAEDTDLDVPPPVKRIKTLLPRRDSITNISSAEVLPGTSNNTTTGTNVRRVRKILSDVNAVDHLVAVSPERAFPITYSRNIENVGQQEEIKSHNINTPKKLDNFDKMLLNVSTQQSPQKNLQFFSSSSSQYSPDCQTNSHNSQIRIEFQNTEKYVELESKTSPNCNKNLIVQKKAKRKSAQKVSSVGKKSKNKKETAANKETKNKRTKKDLIEEMQNASGDHQLIRNFAKTNQISFEQAFRQLMPKIEADIQNICEGWTIYASESDKKEFRSDMKKYFS